MDEGALTEVLEVVLTRVHDVSISTPDVRISIPEGHLLLTEARETQINHELAKIVLPILEVQPEFRVLLQGSVVEGGGLPTKGRLRSSVQLHQRASVRYVACLIHV